MDYTQAYYDDPWEVPALTGPQYDAYGLQWDVDAVAFGKSKGKCKPKGYQSKGYQPPGAKGLKGFDKGKGGKGGKDGKGKSFNSQLKKNAAGLIVFMASCFACGVAGHTGKYCYTQNPAAGINTTCSSCGLWGHKPEYCPKTAIAELTLENDMTSQGPMPAFVAPVEQATALGSSFDLCSIDQAPPRPRTCSGYNSRIGSCSCGHIYSDSARELVNLNLAAVELRPVLKQGMMSNRIDLDLPPPLPTETPATSVVPSYCIA